MKTLTILIATYGERASYIDSMLLPQHDGIEYIIIAQQVEAFSAGQISKKLGLRADVTIKFTSEKGVTKSRNKALDLLSERSDYVLFCDDDIMFEKDIYQKIVEAFEQNDWDVITFSISSPDGGRLLKNYATHSFQHSTLSILKVGTIEVAAKSKIFRDNPTLRFPQYLGAGAAYPLCDEPVLLNRVMRFGYKLGFSPQPIMRHPLESSGKVIESREAMMSRGIAFREIFGIKSFILNIAFFIKAYRKIAYNKTAALKDLYHGSLLSKSTLEKHQKRPEQDK